MQINIYIERADQVSEKQKIQFIESTSVEQSLHIIDEAIDQIEKMDYGFCFEKDWTLQDEDKNSLFYSSGIRNAKLICHFTDLSPKDKRSLKEMLGN